MPNKRERFSRQLARVLIILDGLKSGLSTVSELSDYIAKKLSFDCSKRTVMRDLETLVECGYVSWAVSDDNKCYTYHLTGQSTSIDGLGMLPLYSQELDEELKGQEPC